jgi:pyridoxamine 5'-phosphate oxidase
VPAAATDPIARFRRWLAEARRARIPLAEAMALATADRRGRPSVRFVLLKEADGRGFVFFTDGHSRKGRELGRNPHASFAFYWDRIGKQVRAEGRVEEVSAEEADRYWATRPRASRLAALASSQSASLASRAALVRRWRRLGRALAGKPVPRPRAWTGYRIVPAAIEFWTRGEDRLHHRELFRRRPRGWTRTLLQP